MIARSIEAALESGVFEAVVVSTDDEEIAAVAESCGALAPFRRPPELSNDHATTLPVIAHAIRWWEEHRAPLEFSCCIYATAPFLRAEFLRKGFRILNEKLDAEFAVSVTSYAFPIFRAIQLGESGQFECEPRITRMGTDEDRGMQGFAWTSQAGAAVSNPFTSKLARDCEPPSPILLRKWPCFAQKSF